jgi:hypothetical protein
MVFFHVVYIYLGITSATCHFASPLFDFLPSFGGRLKAKKLKSILHNNKGTYNQHTLVGGLSKSGHVYIGKGPQG